ncbi:hypothetical protein COCCADRAFT_109965, partial [Bipolaris zeicola 26-R-13]
VQPGIYKQFTSGLVVRWVTTSESPLSYVFAILFLRFFFYSPGCHVCVTWHHSVILMRIC